MTEYICNFCNNSFWNKTNLDKHKKTAKYCLELQKINIECNTKSNTYKCNFCNKEYLRKDILDTHLLKCKIKIKNENKNKEEELIKNIKLIEEYKFKYKENEIKYELANKSNIEYLNIINEQKLKINDLENQIKILYDKILSLESKTNVININSVINNLTPLTDSHIKETASLLQTKDILKGAESLAIFARDHSFKDRVICTDVTRRNFIFKDENNNIIKDPKGVKITKKFIENNKPELINLLTQYSLTFYNENSFMDIKHKLEIDHCLDAIRNGDISYNVHKYNNFEKIFTTCFGKFVYDKKYIGMNELSNGCEIDIDEKNTIHENP
jgi:hypothetical protein